MTTRELIQAIRDCKTGHEEFNALLEECAEKIETAVGGPEEAPFQYVYDEFYWPSKTLNTGTL